MTTRTELAQLARPADPFAAIPGAYDEDDYTPQTARPLAVPVEPVQDVPPVRTLTQIVDCPACVWNDFGATGLDGDFVREWSFALHSAGAELIRPQLTLAWRKRGYHAELVCHHLHKALGEIAAPTEVCHEVWQEAVDQITGAELVFAAGLVDEHAAWGDR